ncbi:MAG: autotransporter-associated beta strand repeat-containing protein [Flavobacteriales bacterium]
MSYELFIFEFMTGFLQNSTAVKNISPTILFFLLFSTINTKAATYTWDGSSSNLWNTAANWDLNAVPPAGSDLVFPSGASNISTSNDIAAGTSFASITFGSGASAYTLAGNAIQLSGGATAITANNASNTMIISLNITFTTAAPTITSTSGGTLNISGTMDNGGYDISVVSGGTTTFSGVISGAGGVTISGTGNFTLSGANTYSGTVTIGAQSNVFVGHNTGLGSTAGATTLTAGANPYTFLYINSGVTVTGETLTLNSNSGASTRSYLRHSSGTSAWNGTITIAGTGTTGIYGNGTSFTVAGTIGGSCSSFLLRGTGTGTLSAVCTLGSTIVSKVDAGTWTISSTGNSWGAITGAVGTLKMGATNALYASTELNTGQSGANAATVDLNGYSQTVAGIQSFTGTLTRQITNTGTSSVVLTSNSSGSWTLDNAIITDDGTHTLSFVKAGSGTQIFSTANTYIGTTTITAGTLQLGAAGVISNSSDIIANGGTLSTGSGAGYNETVGTLTLNANSTIALGTGSHSLNFAASNGTAWTGGTLLQITGWQGNWDCSSGTSGKVYTGSSAELSAAKLNQVFFTHPISGLPYTACQLNDGEIVPTSTLPVKLVSFTGKKGENFNELYWITATEINSDYFEVMRSSDGINYEPIAKVKAAGNSNNFVSYLFVDYEQTNGISYYQLKQYDYDGSHETFNTVAIDNNVMGFKINSLFPNPTSNHMTVNFQSCESGAHYLFINDAQGNEVYSAMIATFKGDNQFQLPTQNYSSGIYYVRLVSPKGDSVSSQIVVQH